MNVDKKLLYCAVVAALGGAGAAGANAAVSVVAAELAPGSQIAAGAFANATTPYAPTASDPLYIQFSLTNGASWLANPGLACSGASAGGAGAIAPANVVLVAGGAGTAFVTYVITAISAAAQVTSCTLTNGNIQVDAWPNTITEKVVFTYGGNLTPTGMNSTALLAASSLFSNAITAGVNTAAVSSAFVSFSTTTNTATTMYTARIGTIDVRVNDNLLATASPANANGLVTYASALLVSVFGAPLAAATNVFITSAGGGTSATCAGTVKASMPGNSGIGFSAFAAPNSDSATYAVCMSVSGGTPIPAGNITLSMTAVANLDQVHPTFAPYQVGMLFGLPQPTLGRITRDGSSTTVLSLPRSADAGGDQGFLRIYNTSTGTGAVTANIYVDGRSDGSSALLAMNCPFASALAGKSALILSMTQVESALVACGAAIPSSGRYRLEINGVFPTMRAQAYVRTGGILTNVSPDTPSDGN